jgi:hypothetical protein
VPDTSPLSIRGFKPHEKDEMEIAAKRQGLSRSAWVRQVIRWHLDKEPIRSP